MLFGFDPACVARAYPSVDDWERLLDTVVAGPAPGILSRWVASTSAGRI